MEPYSADAANKEFEVTVKFSILKKSLNWVYVPETKKWSIPIRITVEKLIERAMHELKRDPVGVYVKIANGHRQVLTKAPDSWEDVTKYELNDREPVGAYVKLTTLGRRVLQFEGLDNWDDVAKLYDENKAGKNVWLEFEYKLPGI